MLLLASSSAGKLSADAGFAYAGVAWGRSAHFSRQRVHPIRYLIWRGSIPKRVLHTVWSTPNNPLHPARNDTRKSFISGKLLHRVRYIRHGTHPAQRGTTAVKIVHPTRYHTRWAPTAEKKRQTNSLAKELYPQCYHAQESTPPNKVARPVKYERLWNIASGKFLERELYPGISYVRQIHRFSWQMQSWQVGEDNSSRIWLNDDYLKHNDVIKAFGRNHHHVLLRLTWINKSISR